MNVYYTTTCICTIEVHRDIGEILYSVKITFLKALFHCKVLDFLFHCLCLHSGHPSVSLSLSHTFPGLDPS